VWNQGLAVGRSIVPNWSPSSRRHVSGKDDMQVGREVRAQRAVTVKSARST
jgi:hypothetical protein